MGHHGGLHVEEVADPESIMSRHEMEGEEQLEGKDVTPTHDATPAETEQVTTAQTEQKVTPVQSGENLTAEQTQAPVGDVDPEQDTNPVDAGQVAPAPSEQDVTPDAIQEQDEATEQDVTPADKEVHASSEQKVSAGAGQDVSAPQEERNDVPPQNAARTGPARRYAVEGTGNRIHVCVIVCTLIVMLTMFGVNAINSASLLPGVFLNEDVGALSDKYFTEITPAGATFSIWGAIYFWQVLFISYGLSTICRQGPDGYLYYSPGIMPVGIYVSYIINNLLNISWLFLFDREIMIAALVVIALMWFTLFIALFLSHKALHEKLDVLRKFGMMKEAWLVRFLVQNAHAFYITWITVATLLNLTIVLSYTNDIAMDQSNASTVSLCILGGEITIWVILDFCVLHKYTNYLFSPYIVLPIALGGSLAKNFNPWHRNSIITVALLGQAVLAFICKIVLMIARPCLSRKCPPISGVNHPVPA